MSVEFPRDAHGTLADIQTIAVDDEMDTYDILDEIWTILERYRKANPDSTKEWGIK